MLLKDFESQLDKINRELTEYLQKAETEELEQTEKVFAVLEGGIAVKQSILSGLEADLDEKLRQYELDLKKIEAQIQSLETGKNKSLHHLPSKQEELEAKSNEKLRAFMQAQKKKKADLLQKINAFKRDLAAFHKENNYRLIDEEKDYRGREAELNRRLTIDVDRETDNNIKAYGEYEKTLLETNDDQQIEELKKKIKEIRVAGLESICSIKNKYAYSHFENNYGFKKFQEKVIMENALKTEESKILVRSLETEKQVLEQEEELAVFQANFENQKILLQLERENALHENQLRLEKQLEVLRLRQEGLDLERAKAESVLKMQADYRTELFSFAQSQTDSYRPVLDELNKTSDAVYARILESLREAVGVFQTNLILLLEVMLSEKKSANDRLKSVLLLAGAEHPPYSNFSYQDLLLRITKATEIRHRCQKQRLNEVRKIIAGIIDNILKQVDSLASTYVNYMQAVRTEDQVYLDEIQKILSEGEQAQRAFDEGTVAKTDSGRTGTSNSLRKQKHLLQKEAKQNELRIIREYNRKEQKLKEDSENYEADLRLRKKKTEDEDREFVRHCKQKMQDLKKHYSENIVRSEKELYYIYQDELEKNKTECRMKIHEL
jgi:hypothetical protein